MPSTDFLTRAGLMAVVAVVVGFSALGPLLKKPAPDTVRYATMTSGSPVTSDGVGSERVSARAISHATTTALPVPGNGSGMESAHVRAISYLTIDDPAPAMRNTVIPPANELAPAFPAQSLPPAEDALAPTRQGALQGEQQLPGEANATDGAPKVDRHAAPRRSGQARKPKQTRVRAIPFSYSQSLGVH
jgi:hypothetical protein